MKLDKKYYVEWSVEDHLHRSEVILPQEIADTLTIREYHNYVKDYIKEYYESITKVGTRVEIRSIKYMGTVLRIE